MEYHRSLIVRLINPIYVAADDGLEVQMRVVSHNMGYEYDVYIVGEEVDA